MDFSFIGPVGTEEVKVYRVPGYETGYGCGMESRHISYAKEFNTYFMF